MTDRIAYLPSDLVPSGGDSNNPALRDGHLVRHGGDAPVRMLSTNPPAHLRGLLGSGLLGGAPMWPTTVRLRVPPPSGHGRAEPCNLQFPPQPPDLSPDQRTQLYGILAYRGTGASRATGSDLVTGGNRVSWNAQAYVEGRNYNVGVVAHVDAHDRVHHLVVTDLPSGDLQADCDWTVRTRAAAATSTAGASPVPDIAAGLEAHLKANFGAVLDQVLQADQRRLTMDVQVAAAMLDVTNEYLSSRGVDVATDPAIDAYLSGALDVALGIAASNPACKPACDKLRANFRPQAFATFRVLREELDALPSTRPIDPRHRWRLFVDPAILDAISACGIDTDHNLLMAFVLDGEQPGYCFHYASGLAAALGSKDEVLDFERFCRIAKETCDVGEIAESIKTGLTCTVAGRGLLADTIDYLVDPHNITVKLVNPFSNEEADFSPGKENMYRTLVGGERSTGTTRELIDRLAANDANEPQEVRFIRTARPEDLTTYMRNAITDYSERTTNLPAAATRDESPGGQGQSASPAGAAPGGSGNDDSPVSSGASNDRPLLAAGYRLHVDVCRAHLFSNGSVRHGAVLLNTHLAKHGQPLTVLYDGMTADGGDVPEGCDLIEDGQRRVQSWYRPTATGD